MKKVISVLLAVLVITMIAATGVIAAENPQASAKATAAVGDIAILDSGDLAWTTVMSQTIKTANKKDLFIDVSMNCGLYTRTKGKSKDGTVNTAEATAAIDVRVLVDGSPAFPGVVTFNARTQTLTVKFAGYFNGTTVEDEYVELILDTMSANSFNFIADDLSADIHTVEVQAMIDVNVVNDATAKATIGAGSVTIEEVRMVKDDVINF